MIILGVESATSVASVAILKDSKLVFEAYVNNKLTHSQKLLPLIDTALNTAEIKISDVDVFAVSKGPGSFTGLRIGVATIKGLAAPFNTKIAGINTLYGLAVPLANSQKLICPLIDARNGRVFCSAYKAQNGILAQVIKTDGIDLCEFLNNVKAQELVPVFTGEGAVIYKDVIIENIPNAEFAPLSITYSKASNLCCAAQYTQDYETYKTLLPEYFKKSQAEQKEEKK